MKLSDLIEYAITIDNSSLDKTTDIINATITGIFLDIENNGNKPPIKKYIDKLQQSTSVLAESIDAIDADLNELKQELKEHRKVLEIQALKESYQIYERGLRRKHNSWQILNTHMNHYMIYKKDDRQLYASRLQFYSSMHHAALLVRPLFGELVSNLVANDPLYIADEEPMLLDHTRQLFNEEYQSRIRYKVFNETKLPYIANIMPAGQLGFIVFNEFLNVRPLEIIKQYLQEIFIMLKAGGVALITFNNTDIPQSARNFEAGQYCYTPATMLELSVEANGFEILKRVNTPTNVSWLEIKKPGVLTSLRGGQALVELK